jgi:hypothetical protein
MPNSERGGSSKQHAKAGEQSHKNTTGSGSRNPGLKDQLAAARTSSTLRRPNRAIKIADDFQGPPRAAPAKRRMGSVARLKQPGIAEVWRHQHQGGPSLKGHSSALRRQSAER